MDTTEMTCPECGYNEREEWHHCPYMEEMYGDTDFLCECCDECQVDCHQEI